MSLDVYLKRATADVSAPRTAIFIREDGETKEISQAEWDERFPGRVPVTIDMDEGGDYFSWNITHNLGRMAREAGLYDYLWRPEELCITNARELIAPLRAGLAYLESDAARFEVFNPPNGWGTYAVLVRFVQTYLAACEQFPEATVHVYR